MEKLRVLVVDDEPPIVEIIREFLEEQNYEVISSSNGEEGFSLAVEHKPDLVLLDVRLGDSSGYDICRKIRETSSIQHTPIIMLTGQDLVKDEVRGFKAGADDYVTKPFKPGRLLARIQKAIGRTTNDLDANSLTHLPGNRKIMGEIERRVAAGNPYAVMYMDLSNFKSFNDRYGFVRGDEAIKKTADILTQQLVAVKDSDPFLGHVGGDDFVAVLNGYDVQDLCVKIIEDFDRQIAELYDPEDRKRGFIESVDRQGKKADVPLMGIAIAVVTNQHKNFEHPGEIAFAAGDLKKWAKRTPKSNYVIERRTD